METNLNKDSFSKAVKRAKNQYNLIEAGSVFGARIQYIIKMKI